MIIDTIGEPAMLEQLAEECVELAHAALKLARRMRRENPTDKAFGECIEDLTEEVADVELVLEEITWLNRDRIREIQVEKKARWLSRLATISGSTSVQDGASVQDVGAKK